MSAPVLRLESVAESIVAPSVRGRVRRLWRHACGIRWWLGLTFAAVAALTALTVVWVLNARSERAFHTYAEAFAVGRSVIAAESLKHDTTIAALRRDAVTLAGERRLRVYVFDAHGKLIGPSVSRDVPWGDVPYRAQALRIALSGRRFIHGSRDGSEFVVGIPVREGAGAAIVTYTRQQGLRAALGIIRDEFLQTALLALAVGGALGLVVATFIARRLGRIADAASAIGSGDFTAHAHARFPDEVGSLALSVERMRGQLQESFRVLERDRDRLEELLDRLDDGVLVVGRDLEIEFANDRARELVGTTERLDGGMGRLVVDLFDSGLPNQVRLTADGQTLEVTGIPPADGRSSVIVVVRDQSREERNERVQREFATNAAHELRTPLASIVTAVEMLQTGAKHDPDARDRFLDVIANESARLTRLTRALLVLARASAGDEVPRREAVSVAPLLEQVAGSLSPRPGVRISVDCPASLTIAGDPDLLEQALSSVAANAVQHTDRGWITIRGRKERRSIVLEVVDTGHGVAPQQRRRIFERFYRAADREGGFGLGLSIAREAVGALGGKIALDSKLGEGTTVRITLDAAEVES